MQVDSRLEIMVNQTVVNIVMPRRILNGE